MQFLMLVYLGNTIYQWIFAVGCCLLLFFLLRLLKYLLVRRIRVKKEEDLSQIEHFLSGLLDRTKGWFLATIAIYAGLSFLAIPATLQTTLKTIFLALILLQIGLWGTSLIDFWVKHRISKELERDNNNATSYHGLGIVIRIVFWALLVLLILDNIPGVQVNTLVASLGVTGVAVALAVQNILGDLFASLSITLDQPFVLGDFINVGDMTGSVEHIGLKSTRVRSLSGEQLVFSNTDLLNSRIRNYKRMERRRIAFTIGVTYDTAVEKLEHIPDLLREIICQNSQVTFDRAHFKELGSASLNFEVVYFVESPDYMSYMDIHQAINLAIFRTFTEKQIEFAFPTQTVYVQQTELKQ